MLSDLFLLETSTCTQWMIEIMARQHRRVKDNAQDRYTAFTGSRGFPVCCRRND
jgi:hypothetical protein